MIFPFGKQRIFTKTQRNYIMRNICVRDAPCWDPKLRERVKCVEYKLLLSSVPEQNDEMLLRT